MRAQRVCACLVGVLALGLAAPGAAATTAFFQFADVWVVCDGGCDPSVDISSYGVATIISLSSQHVDLDWYHTLSTHKTCSGQGPIISQYNYTVSNGASPNSVGDSNSLNDTAGGIDRWSYVSRSTVSIGGTGGTPLLITWTASHCESEDCVSFPPPE